MPTYTYNGVTVTATGRRPSTRDDKKYMRTVTRDGKDYLIHYGDPDMPMRRSNPQARANFLSRHSCSTKKDPLSPGYWACLDWSRTDEGKSMSEIAELRQQYAELFQVAPDSKYKGVMIALYPSAETATQIAAIPGVATPPEDLHVTLAYLGGVDGLTDVQVAGAILAAQKTATYGKPVTGNINGVGRFNASESSDGQDVIYAVVDLPGLDELRDCLMDELDECDCEPSTSHGYTPHMTLVYIPAGTDSPVGLVPTMPISFSSVSIAVGGKRVDFPLLSMEKEDDEESSGEMKYSDVADLCADGRGWRLFNEHEFAEPPAWVPCLPKPGTFTHPSYGQISVTPDRNQRFVQNFKTGVYQSRIPVDAEHQLKTSGAVGWITDMRLNEDGSADAQVEWTDRGQSLIRSDRYKYVSPEWYDKWTAPDTGNEHSDVLIGLALTTRPFFKEKSLRPLVASERGFYTTDEQVSSNTTVVYFNAFSEVLDMAEKATEQPVTAVQFGELQQKFDELSGKFAAAEAARTEAEVKAKQYAEALDGANARVAALEATAQRKRFGELSANWFGKADDNVNMLTKLAQAFGEESAEFATYVTQQRAIAEQMKQSKLFEEIGSNKSDLNPKTATQKFSDAVLTVMGERKVDYATAATVVAGTQPQLYSEYVAEQRGK
jgi:2'-5' RNA ligase